MIYTETNILVVWAPYTAKHLPLAVYSEAVNKTFFTYGGTTSETENHLLIMVSFYDHETEQLSKPVIAFDKSGVTDPHDNGTIQLDADGYIWLFISGRYSARNGYILRSNQPYDISAFSQVLNEPFNYPQPKYIKDKGFVLLMTNFGSGRELFTKRSSDGYTWTANKKLVAFGGHYQVSGNTSDKIGFAFNWHELGNVDKRTNLYYMQSKDLGDTWTTIQGTALTIPIQASSNPALIKNYLSLGLKVYLKDIRYDRDGYPIILYITSPTHLAGPANPAREWKIARWDGIKWIFTKVTNAHHNYDMGSLYLDNDNTYRILAPTEPGPQIWGTGGEMAIWESYDKGESWRNLGSITSQSARNHSYARRPENCQPEFYAFWADRNTEAFSRSYLYYATKNGDVYQMPYELENDLAYAIPFANIVEIYPQIVSTSHSKNGYPAMKAIDGLVNNESRWESYDFTFPQFIIVDYGEEKIFNTAKLHTMNNEFYNYTVQLSTDLVFNEQPVVSKLNNTSKNNPSIDVFSPTTARYAKLTITGQKHTLNYGVKIKEFELLSPTTNSTELESMAIRAYPNPVRQDNFLIDGLTAGAYVEIFTPSGALLFKGRSVSNKITIDSSMFPKGIVLINIFSNEKKQSIKVIIAQ